MAEQRAAAGPAEIHAYTDGGASPNPGPGGWGAVLLRPLAAGGAAGDAAGEPRVEELSGGEDQTTNNRMELTAAIRALEAAGEGARVRVSTDSRYLQRGITSWLPRWAAGGWRLRDGGEVANQDLWRRLAELTRTRRVSWAWVKGHAGHRWNERADELARAATARRHRVGAETGAGPGSGVTPPAVPVDFDVHLKASGRGGWAARVRPREAGGDSGDGKPGDGDGAEGNAVDSELLTGAQRGASANELILLAAAAALESLPPGAAVAIHTTSDYLRDGASRWLPGWRRAGWRTKTGGEVANRAAWQRLERALAGRRIRWPRPDDAAAAEIAALEKQARAAAGR